MAILLTLAQASAAAAQTCRPDCRSGFVCIDAQCVSACNPPCATGETCSDDRRCIAASPPPSHTSASHDRAPDSDDNMAFVANVLGLLQVGPTIGLEFGGLWTGTVRARIGNLGVMSYLGYDANEWYDYGFGVGAELRRYFASAGNLRGAYLGAGLEWTYSHWTEEVWDSYTSSDFENPHEEIHLVPELEAGYRWVFGSFLLGAGVGAGVGIPIEGESFVAALLVLEIGAVF